MRGREPEGPDDREGFEAAPTGAKAEERSRGFVELVIAIVLAVSGLSTSWSGYQATLWSGEQDTAFNEANKLRIEAARVGGRADLMRAIDVAMFSSWLEALAAGEMELQRFYRERFRPAFQVAFDEWVALVPSNNPDAPPTPFAMPSYRSPSTDEAEALEVQADAALAVAQEKDDIADAYVRATVILASAMFLAGICQVFRSAPVKIGLTVLAALICALGVVRTIGLPVITL